MKIRNDNRGWLYLLLVMSAAVLVACAATTQPDNDTLEPIDTVETSAGASIAQPQLEPTYAAMVAAQRDPRIPDLPFPDNPDPRQCGIPIKWGTDERAWLNGMYEGAVLQENVMLYDSHLRLGISGEAPHGSEVTVLMFQENPNTDYYLVEVKGSDKPVKGWIPEPLLSFTEVEPLPPS